MSHYTIGIDYGSLSARAVLVDVSNGQEIAEATYAYPHAVMDEFFVDGSVLPQDYALQHPQDYAEALEHTLTEVLERADVARDKIIGIGVDFTSCTILPIKADGTPLCFLEEFRNTPQAYAKLWKHHAAQPYAERLNQVAAERGESWLSLYGGAISSEWVFPKAMELVDQAPEVYESADRLIEGGDWITFLLTGELVANSCAAGYKAIYHEKEGYPDEAFCEALDPRLKHFVRDKLKQDITPSGTRAGTLSSEWTEKLGLAADLPVAASHIDAHAGVPAVGISGIHQLMAIIGTSTCFMVMDDQEIRVPGISGVVKDGVMPGFYGYEAGQSCVGDHFSWFVDNLLPADYLREAEANHISPHALLRQKAERQKPGEHGLVALDWWNGNRSILVDFDLTGMIVGLTLRTKAEDIYRALIEATAYGARVIVENYRQHGVNVAEFFASGGIANKDPLMMQIYADVLNLEIKIAKSMHGPAVGSAIHAAACAGAAAGGYYRVGDAARAMGHVQEYSYRPIPENVAVYDQLFAEYLTLHDYFGRQGNEVMKRLKKISAEQGRG